MLGIKSKVLVSFLLISGFIYLCYLFSHAKLFLEYKSTLSKIQEPKRKTLLLNDVRNLATHTSKVTLLHNVCFELDNSGSKSITAYNSTFNGNDFTLLSFKPPIFNKWNVRFSKQDIPDTHTFVNGHAYFVNYSYYGNLHHILSDTLDDLYIAMKIVGDPDISKNDTLKLHALAGTSDIEFQTDMDNLDKERRKLSDCFLGLLGFSYNDVYKTVSDNTCYKMAIFPRQLRYTGLSGKLEDAIRTKLNVDKSKCPSSQKLQIIIQARHSRRILNTDELQSALESMVNASVRIIYFEDISMKEQIQSVVCSDLLIGIQGAGLEHYRFMKKKSGIIELGYYRWPAGRYCKSARSRGQVAFPIPDCAANLSDTSFINFYKHNPELREQSKEEILALSKHVGKYNTRRSIWKYADCTVNVTDVVNKVRLLSQQLKSRKASK